VSRAPTPTASRSLVRLALQSLALGWRTSPAGSSAQLALTIVVGALPAPAAWFGKLLMDELARGEAASTILVVRYAVAGSGVIAVVAIGGHLMTLLGQYNRLAASAVLEARLFDRVNRLVGLRYFEDPAYHDRLRLAQLSAQEAPGEVANCATQTLRALVALSGFLVVVVHLWPPMLVLVLVCAAVALGAQAWLARVNTDAIRERARSDRQRAVFQLMLVDARAAKETRIYGLGRFFHDRMMRAMRRGMAIDMAVGRREAVVQSAFAVVGGAIAVVGTVVVARRVTTGAATVGDVAFLTAAIAGLQAGLSGIIESFGRATQAARLLAEIAAIEDATDLPAGKGPVPPLRGGIELRDIWFRYEGGPWVLRGVSVTIAHGRAVGLVGLNGAGKSTLVKLLCRFHDPERGQILWDGTDIREFEVHALRRRIAATYQDYVTFDLTAAESIGVGDLAHAGDAGRVRAAATRADVHDIIARLPRGYATMVSRLLHGEEEDEQGVMLSGGQAQRLALARSLMRDDADLAILDEPSAGLDALAEHRIHTALRERRRGRTTLMISHRLSALRDADVIVVLADGAVAEQGTHDELFASGGGYAQLFAVQAAGYRESVGTRP